MSATRALRAQEAAGSQVAHVWLADLDRSGGELEALGRLLSPDERQRASRLRLPRDRRRLIVARATLRILLGRRLDVRPERLRFGYGAHDKPFLVGSASCEALQFNVSHSGPLAAFALSQGARVGIDVERARLGVERERIARRIFGAREASELERLRPGLRRRSFFCCWTRKEAYVKARGDGLAYPLERFQVPVSPEDPAALLWHAEGECERSRWTLRDLPLPLPYFGCLVVEGPLRSVLVEPWPAGGFSLRTRAGSAVSTARSRERLRRREGLPAPRR